MKGVLKDRTKIFLKECYPRIYKDKRKIIASWLESFRVLQASHLEIFLWNLSKWKTSVFQNLQRWKNSSLDRKQIPSDLSQISMAILMEEENE